MRFATHLLPQAERLAGRIERLDARLIELWGWPGSGAAGVLQAFLARPGAVGLAPADLADREAAHAACALAAAAAARWLVVAGDPGEHAADLASWLHPDQQLIFTSTRRWTDLPQQVALIPPQELLLSAPEIGRLWYLITGRQPGVAAVQALAKASDGWYRPLRLALEATNGAGLDSASAERLLEIAEVRLFLRHQILDAPPAADRDLLLAAPRERPPAAQQDAWDVVERRGLWVEGQERDRLPALLAASLERERRRRRPGAAAAAASAAIAGNVSSVASVSSGATGAGAGGAASAPAAAGGAGGAAASLPAVPRGRRRLREPERRTAYQVRLFGPPAVYQIVDGEPREVGWTLRRSFLVLAFLASSPGLTAVREDMEEAVWPADGEHTIDRNFHPTLSHMRRSLALPGGRGSSPSPLLYRAGGYRLNPDIDWDIDVQKFQCRIEEGRELAAGDDLASAAAAWRGAWKVYGGPFLQGHYAAWAVARREAYQHQYVELLRNLGDLSVRLDHAVDALDAFRAVLIEDPLQERTHLAVMRLYAGQARRDLVRRQYERLCSLLLDELGVEPLPETVQEYHRLMS